MLNNFKYKQSHTLSPDLSLGPELLVEVSNCTGTADIVSHEHVRFHPNIVVRRDTGAIACLSDNLLRQGHRCCNLINSSITTLTKLRHEQLEHNNTTMAEWFRRYPRKPFSHSCRE